MAARESHVCPGGSLTRTPSWIGLVRSIVTPVTGRLLRSYRSFRSAMCSRVTCGFSADSLAKIDENGSVIATGR
jgi:hypothetical protein